MADKITIAELGIDTDSLLAKAKETKDSLDALKKSTNELKKAEGDNNAQLVKNEVQIKKLSSSYNQQKNTLVQLTDSNNNFVKTEQALENALNKNISTIEEARKSNKELLAIRNKINVNTDEGKKQLDNINGRLDDNNKFIKENVSAYEQQKIGIGNYEDAIRKVFPNVGALIDGLKSTRDGLKTASIGFKQYADAGEKTADTTDKLKNAVNLSTESTNKGSIGFGRMKQSTNEASTATDTAKKSTIGFTMAKKASTAATTGASKALRIFKIALISTGIGAIVVVLGSLIAAFASTQKGADEISKALAPIKGALQGIIGVIQDIALNVFGQLGNRFTIVSGGILNGLDKIRLGWNRISGDTEEAEIIAARIADRLVEVGRAQSDLNKQTQSFSNILGGAGEKIAESAQAQKEIAVLQIQIEKAENRLIVSRSESNRIIKESNKIAEDTTKTLSEREAAAKRAINESDNLLKAEQSIIDLQIEQQTLKNSQNDTDRTASKELAELEAQRNEKQTAILEQQTTLTNKLNIIRTQAEGERKKAQDERIAKNEAEQNQLEEAAAREAEKQAEIDNKKLEQITLFEQRKRDLLNKIALDNATTDEEKATIKAEQDLLKQQKDLENLELTEFQKNELEKLLLTEHNIALAEINNKFNEDQIVSEKDLQKSKQELREKTFDKAIALADGESKLGKAILAIKQVFLLKESLIEASKVKNKAAASAASASASIGEGVASTASIGFPQNIPLLIGFATQIGGVVSAIKSASKFEKGGLQEIGGKRHSSGGTKFVGDDGTRFEAEKGELIGVMSRSASQKFMEFNDTHTPNSALFGSMSLNSSKFANGGLIDMASNTSSSSGTTADTTRSIINEINKIKIVTVVDDVTSMQGIQTEIRSGADV